MFGIDAPADGAFAVTSSNTTSFANAVRGLYVGGTGDVSVLMRNGSSATFEEVPAGTFMPLRALRVNETGTSATSIVGLQ